MKHNHQPRSFKPKDPLSIPRFADIATFSRLPHTLTLDGVDLAIVGIPFDGGTTYRPGARLGPRAIRAASCLNRNVHAELGVDIYERLAVIDYGDIPCNPLNIQKTFEEIQSTYGTLLDAGVIPAGLGGDHSILLPILRAYKKAKSKSKQKRFGIIHFDAHSDTGNQAWGEPYHHGTSIRRAIEEGCVQGTDIYQIGLRGPLTSASQYEWDRSQGIHQLMMDGFHDQSLSKFLKTIDRSIPYYLTFDIDGVDPAFAPGTGTPVVGGLTSREALHALRQLKGIKLVGFDVVEVSPPYDQSEITSLLASAILFECMALVCLERI